jgi:hypothetical protein
MNKKQKGNLITTLLLGLAALLLFGGANLGLQEFGVPMDEIASRPFVALIFFLALAFLIVRRKKR